MSGCPRRTIPASPWSHGPAKDGARYFGPYGGRSATAESIKAICNALRLPTCRRQFPRDIGKERPCLNHHLGICDGWCRGRLTQADYQARIYQAVRLLEGKFSQVEQELRESMNRAAEELRFEEAGRAARPGCRRSSCSVPGSRRSPPPGRTPTWWASTADRPRAALSCSITSAVPSPGGDTEVLPTPMEEETAEIVSALAKQYYLGRSTLPREILLPRAFDDLEELGELLTQNAGRKVTLTVPKRGDRLNLVQLAERTALDEAERATTAQERQSRLMELLGRTLGLERAPERIEAYDISNTGASNIVASMTVFVEGKPLRRDYRRFKLRDMDHRTTTPPWSRCSPAAFAATWTGTRSSPSCPI